MKYTDLIDSYLSDLNQQHFDKNILYQIIYARDARIPDLMTLADYLKTEVPLLVEKQIKLDLHQLLNEHKPLAYILGYAWFLGQKFKVNQKVFSPRPETEYWVDYLISILETYPTLKILDLCCGTGVIGLSIKKQLPNMDVYLVDNDQLALANARENAQSLKVDVKIINSDLFSNLDNVKFDLIICNPPYIAFDTALEPSLQYESQAALFAKENGLFFYKKILVDFKKHVTDNYWLVFEIGFDQASALKLLTHKALGDKINLQVLKDQYNQDRVVIINRK